MLYFFRCRIASVDQGNEVAFGESLAG